MNYTNIFHGLSTIQPEILRKFLFDEIGERSKDKLYNHLKELEHCYPKFDHWFYNVVIPEVELRDGKREIIIALTQMLDTKKTYLTGIAILKKTKDEKKICTFRIHENYRNMGIGTALFEQCFLYLETRKPLITVSSDRLEMFRNHIDHFDFRIYQSLDNFYKQGSTEYVYNGYLL
ncbi:GNAT family N-acetyltransferase [Paenibacillus faecis]|uniref:GNAT family N-acetyltransferase n=1 Tax=Paenibacillus faecis TaxID=862114 RepID=A0A5D0D1X9_9BACL|nr:GNAT family N-acetyltransferase [Paenibacillus faecis]TYA14695.1 GNAT family N-acetyltransferase [Paenibacillus faecis]